MNHPGYELKAHLKTLPATQHRWHLVLDEPAAVRLRHRLVRREGDEIIDGDVWTDFLIYEIWENCFFGECERPTDSKPWWAVKEWEKLD